MFLGWAINYIISKHPDETKFKQVISSSMRGGIFQFILSLTRSLHWTRYKNQENNISLLENLPHSESI